MRFKTTDKVTGEIVLGGLNLVLKKNSFFDISKEKTSHHELIWAIHNGYVEAADVAAQTAVGAKKKVYINSSKKTIVSANLKSPLMPGQTLMLLEEDPTCLELDKLVEMKLITYKEEEVKTAEVETVTPKKEVKEPSKNETRKSFKKKPSGYKAKSEEKSSNSNKIISESKPTIFSPKEKTIFVGENNEELDI